MKKLNKNEATVGQFIAGGVRMPKGSGADSKGREVSAVLALFEAAGWAMGGQCLTGCWNMFSDRISDQRVSILFALRAVGLQSLSEVVTSEITWRQRAGAQWLVCGESDMPLWAIGQDLDELDALGLGSTVAALAEWLGLGSGLLPEQLGQALDRQKALESVREFGWN